MGDDNTFRLALLLAFAAFAPVAVYHRLRSVTDEKLDRWQEGAFILFGLRLGGLPLFVGGVAWMIDPQWMTWSSLPLSTWLRWLGIALGNWQEVGRFRRAARCSCGGRLAAGTPQVIASSGAVRYTGGDPVRAHLREV